MGNKKVISIDIDEDLRDKIEGYIAKVNYENFAKDDYKRLTVSSFITQLVREFFEKQEKQSQASEQKQ
jgi:5'(3')-deoxyribonucleotidase